MLNTNNNLSVADLPNNRARKLAWMREGYSWHIIFTDYMANIIPLYDVTKPKGFININMGSNNYDQESVPPTGATTNAE